MKYKLLLLIIVFFNTNLICLSQEIQKKGDEYVSEGVISTYGLDKAEVISAIKLLEFNGISDEIFYSDADPGFIILKFSAATITKDPMGRTSRVIAYVKIYIKADKVKIYVEDIELSYYPTMDRNSQEEYIPLYKTKLKSDSAIESILTILNDYIYDSIKLSLLQEKKRRDF